MILTNLSEPISTHETFRGQSENECPMSQHVKETLAKTKYFSPAITFLQSGGERGLSSLTTSEGRD